MKKLFLLSVIIFIALPNLFAQNVPNGGFESWTGGNPDNWITSNSPPIIFTVTQSSTAHSGSSSVRGDVISFSGIPLNPLIQSGTLGKGFPISQRFATLSGYYQFNSVQSDRLLVTVLFTKSQVGVAGNSVPMAAVSSWTQFNMNIFYATGDTPDTCYIQVTIAGPTSGGAYHAGSFFLVDDLDLSGTATSVKDPNIIPAKFSLEQNYPNPFNPSTKIKFNLPEKSFVTLKVYNTIGAEVASLVNGVLSEGVHETTFDASKLNSGIYFYTLKAGNNFIQTKKMILLK
jgi:hypothetical protein